jgi:hypothetical protein
MNRVLFICGSINQTSQLHAVARALLANDDDKSQPIGGWFTPYYGNTGVRIVRRLGLAEMTIVGKKRGQWCLDWLQTRGLPIDLYGKRGGYDLVVSCSDILVQDNVRHAKKVVVQEGILDPERWLAWLCRRVRVLPRICAGTALTGESGSFDRFCVASDGYENDFVRRGVDRAKLVTTGIPNFDDCARYRENSFPHRNFVLAATSDTRETLKLTDRRRAFIERALAIANGRQLIFKLHPNEDEQRERRLIAKMAPQALVFKHGCAEEMIANCDVLVAQWSSVAFVGLALGKEVHSSWPPDVLRRLMPIQNGGTSARRIANVCRELLGMQILPLKSRSNHSRRVMP